MRGRKPRLVTVNGVTRSISEWSEISGVAVGTIRQRLDHDWNPETAVYEPPRKARGLIVKDPALCEYKEPSHLNQNGDAVRKFTVKCNVNIPRPWMADCGIFYEDKVLVRFCGDHIEVWPCEC